MVGGCNNGGGRVPARLGLGRTKMRAFGHKKRVTSRRSGSTS